MGTNIVGEERNEPNNNPTLAMPEDGRSLMDLDFIAGISDAVSGAAGFLGNMMGGIFTKLLIVGGMLIIKVLFGAGMIIMKFA